MSEIFDKRFVHFMWDDELEGKKVFVADGVNTLIECVEKGTATYTVQYSRNMKMPFERDDFVCYRFAYYDPNYEIKKAFNEGKEIQYQLVSGVDWGCVDSEEALECRIEEGRQFRVKPEKVRFIVYLDRPKDCHCYLTTCREEVWKAVQELNGAKTKLFISDTIAEAIEWLKARQKFAEIIKAWEDGKTIQFYSTTREDWRDVIDNDPFWEVNVEYRVKPKCPCEDGIDSKACAGCEHSEDGKKEYRPYINSAEMIMDFINRFENGSAKAPSHCEPLIWVKGKGTGNRYLVFAFCENAIEFNDVDELEFEPLFNCYTYLDGSPVGMEVKE